MGVLKHWTKMHMKLHDGLQLQDIRRIVHVFEYQTQDLAKEEMNSG